MPFIPKKAAAPVPFRPKTHEWVFVKDPDQAGVAYHAFVTNALLPNEEFMVILDHTDRSTGIPSVIELTQAEMQGRTVCTTLGLADLYQTCPAGHEVRPYSDGGPATSDQVTTAPILLNNPTPESVPAPANVLAQETPAADAALANAKDAGTHPAAQEAKRRPGRPKIGAAATTGTALAAPATASAPVEQVHEAVIGSSGVGRLTEAGNSPTPAVIAVLSAEERSAMADEIADKAVAQLKAWVLAQLIK